MITKALFLSVGSGSFQLGIIAALVLFLATIVVLRWSWFVEIYVVCSEIVGWVLWGARALAFGYGTYLIIIVTANVGAINSWERLISLLLLDAEQYWIASWSQHSRFIGYLVAFYAWAGGFWRSSAWQFPFRGRKVVSDAEARRRLNKSLGRPEPKPPTLWRRFQFRMYLVRQAVVRLFRCNVKTVAKLDRMAVVEESRSEGLFWGNLALPYEVGTSHFAVVGSTNAGKTLTLRMLMQSVLPRLGQETFAHCGKRALVFDPKQDMHSILHGMNPKVPIITFNPFDDRTVSWDLSVDIDSPAAARQFAEIFVPDEKRATQKFFSDAARALFAATMIALDKIAPGNWDLRDVLLALHSQSALQNLLKRSDEAWNTASLYFEDPHSFPAVMSTVATKTAPYRVVAATWHGNRQKFSITQWLKSESILILGHYPAARNSIEPINQAFLERLSQLLLQEPEIGHPATWIFLDELRALGTVPCLPHLLTQGRSKGACIVMGFQAIEGLRELYGPNVPDEMVGQCSNRTFLRTSSHVTAAWIERLFGVYETIEPQFSESTSSSAQGSSSSQSVSYNPVTRNAVLASEMMSIPVTGREHGLSAFHDIASVGSYSTHLSSEELDLILKKPNPKVDNVQVVGKAQQTLTSWGPEDLERLKLLPSDAVVAEKEQIENKLHTIRREDI